MALSQSKQNKDVDLIDTRASLYYGKYNYRARFYCPGINLAWYCDSVEDVDLRAKKFSKSRLKTADIDGVKKFVKWKLDQPNTFKGKSKQGVIRIEGNIAAVFSNDLTLLKTLNSLGYQVDYTKVDDNIVEGVKLFKEEPKHKYRIYLKSKRITDDFHNKLKGFVDRYKNTDNKMIPSPSLRQWLNITHDTNTPSWSINNWRLQYCSSHFFLDYDEESSLTLFMLMFPSWVNRKFKLEKRPE